MSDPSRDPKPTEDHQAIFALNELIKATRSLATALNAATRDLHADLDLSVSERGLLITLRQAGDRTVPNLARRRDVSRQFIQSIVNALLARGLVTTRANPLHRRSRLVTLTPAGVTLIRDVMRREGAVLQGLAGGLTAAEIRRAAATVAQVNQQVAAKTTEG